MQVSEILANKGRRIVSVSPAASFRDIANRLKEEAIGAVVVCDGHQDLQGIVSERDLVRSISEQGSAALSLSAKDLMSGAVVTCEPASSTSEIMERMLDNQIRHLPVVEKGRLVGVISINDVVRAVHGELNWMTKVLQDQVVILAGRATDDQA